jgi:hypothetical protein
MNTWRIYRFGNSFWLMFLLNYNQLLDKIF